MLKTLRARVKQGLIVGQATVAVLRMYSVQPFADLIEDLRASSHGLARFEIVETVLARSMAAIVRFAQVSGWSSSSS